MIKITFLVVFSIISSIVSDADSAVSPKRLRVSAAKCIEYSKYVYENVSHVELDSEADENYDEVVERPVEIVQVSVCGHTSVQLITGGEAAKEREFPHQALIGYALSKSFYDYYCGGSLISDEFIISAAHCSYHSELKAAKYALLGDISRHGILDHTYKFEIIERIKHPLYNSFSVNHDIMLFRLDHALKLGIYKGFVRPICLPQTNIDYNRNSEVKAIATGFGSIGPLDKLSENLLKVTLKIYDQQVCSKIFENDKKLKAGVDKISKICAGNEDKKDTCSGDSGGPLQVYNTDNGVDCMYTIIGITSFGNQNCGAVPAVYTKVYNYLDWIEKMVWKN